jgi:hypothetical protein
MKLGEPYPILAQLTHAPLLDEIGVVLAPVLMLVGLALHLYLPRHRMAVEERIKDNKMTPAEARRQMRFYAVCAPTVTLLGVALVILVAYDLAQ